MGAPTPAGRRIVKLDGRLARLDLASHEWSETRADPAATVTIAALSHVALRPWRPVHLRARRLGSGDVTISWVRQARVGGFGWGPGEPPLGAPSEAYQVEILSGAGVVLRVEAVASPLFIYSAAAQTADFGAPPANLRLRVAQIGADGQPGLKTESTIPL